MGNQILKGKVAVVCGASRNLGSLICKTLGEEGASVVVHYNSNSSKAEAEGTVKAIEAAGGEAFAFRADLTKVPEVVALFDETVKRLSRLDISVNAAGMVLKKPFVEVTEEEYYRIFDVNAKAAFFVMREAAKRMNDGGKIITIVTSLLAAFTGLYSAYAGSKAPVEHFTRALAKELGPRGISVKNIAPGPLDTPFFYPVESPEAVAYHKSASMNGKLGDIKDIAPIVKFLVTEGWWITGQTIFANGGYTTR